MLFYFLCCFDLFVNSTHNVAPQEEVVDLWHHLVLDVPSDWGPMAEHTSLHNHHACPNH
jgi:hypothetical protein